MDMIQLYSLNDMVALTDEYLDTIPHAIGMDGWEIVDAKGIPAESGKYT